MVRFEFNTLKTSINFYYIMKIITESKKTFYLGKMKLYRRAAENAEEAQR